MFTIIYLVAAYVGIVALIVAVSRSVDRSKARARAAQEQYLHDLVEREIDRAYRAAGNPPPPPPNGTRRPQ